MLEYTAHAAVAEVRSLVTPVAAQTCRSRAASSRTSAWPRSQPAAPSRPSRRCGSRSQPSWSSRCERLRLAGQEPVGAGTQELWQVASEQLDPDLYDRPLHPDLEVARRLIEAWRPAEGAEPARRGADARPLASTG